VSVAERASGEGATGRACASPGTVAPEEILAYAEGAASLRVVSHVATCPACRYEAAGLAAAERALRGRLVRVACPSPQTIGEYQVDLLSAAPRTSVAAHLVECARCADELRILRDMLAFEPGAALRPIERLRRSVARLVDLSAGRWQAALRGAMPDENRLYEAEGLAISIRLSPGARHSLVSLICLVLPEGDAAPPAGRGRGRLLDADGRQVADGEIDELGGVAFDDLAPGAYQLELVLGERLIVVERLEVR
jgi:hypothetical protein